MSKVAIGAYFFDGQAVSQNDAVSQELVEDGFVVLLPSLAEIGTLTGLHFEEIIARVGQNSGGSR